MRIRWTTRIMTAAGVLTLITGIAANGGPANAASSKPTSTARPYTTRYVTGGALQGVAAGPAGRAWAVGYTGTPEKPKTLIVAWNGRTWATAPGFAPVAGELSGIWAVSAKNAWAVGCTGSPNASPRTLLLHWNGRTWATVTTPTPVGGTFTAVTATASYAWVDGSTSTGAALIWHWNGTAWARSPTTGAPGHVALLGVAAHSAGSAWAVGADAKGAGPRGVSTFWNGAAWAKTPAPATGNLSAVAAVPGGTAGGATAWAVGTSMSADAFSTLILRWTGKAWSKVASPTPTGYGSLTAVAATSNGSAWAVGSTGLSDSKTLILHWNGTTWS